MVHGRSTQPPLIAAASHNHPDIVKLLIDNGAQIGEPEKYASPRMAAFIRSEYARVHHIETPVAPKPAELGTVPNPVDAPDYRERPRPDDLAVVVGVEQYAQGLPRAEFADQDARAFRAHLIALGLSPRHIVFLSDQRAGRSELVKNIERWLPKNVKPDSDVFFYFSGHGSPDPGTGDAYLLGFDGDPEDLADTAYPLSRLYKDLSRLKARRVVALLDSCFSGAGGRSVVARGTRPLVNRVKEGVVSKNGRLIVLTASKSDQISGVLEDQGHGAFTYYVLKGLNGAALKDGHVTVDSLYHYAADSVADAAHLDSRDQDPQMLPVGAAPGAGEMILR